MMIIAGLFWCAAACVAYAYLVYPALMGVLGALASKPVGRVEGHRPTATVLLAALNEEATIGRRVEEFRHLMSSQGIIGEVLVVSDGSTDRTVEIVSGLSSTQDDSGVAIRCIDLPSNRGKAVALTAGGEAATGEVVVLADARQTWASDAVARLLENFADPQVGAVSGELMLESSPGVQAGVGLYWRFEKWLRQRESRFHSMVGVTGAISAVRREAFRPIPEGTILDDVYWPMQVAMQGLRVVFDGRALAYDRLPDKIHDEFRRKVRTLSGNFQLLTRLPALLNPLRNPIWFQFVSHKLARLAVPWALLYMPAACLILGGPVYLSLFALQALGYAVAIAGLFPSLGGKSRLAAAGGSFLVLNAAAWMAFWVWISGRASRSWRKATYLKQDVGPTPQHDGVTA
jgi:biofilm PGA synthesis N-glycosyltransferase PgaC